MTVNLNAEFVLIALLALSGLAILWRGFTYGHRDYTPWDAIFGSAECVFMIWLVTVVAR